MDLWWDIQDKQALLYAGLHKFPIASIMASNNGKWYSYLIEIPVNTMGWKTYMPKEELMDSLEKIAHEFFDLANTSRPAMDCPDA